VFRSFHTVLCWVHVCCIFIKKPFLILTWSRNRRVKSTSFSPAGFWRRFFVYSYQRSLAPKTIVAQAMNNQLINDNKTFTQQLTRNKEHNNQRLNKSPFQSCTRHFLAWKWIERCSNRRPNSGTRPIRSQICMTHVPETGTRKKWSRFKAPVSGACVVGVVTVIKRMGWRQAWNYSGIELS